MSDHQPTLRASHFAECPGLAKRAQLQLSSIALAACIGALALMGTVPALATQPCSTASGPQGYWSWRMIDGRKCWYQGKPMLSKSLLEWPAEASASPPSGHELASETSAQHGNPLDAQDSVPVPDDSATFDALWQSRIAHQIVLPTRKDAR